LSITIQVELQDKFLDWLHVQFPWAKSPEIALQQFVTESVEDSKEIQLMNSRIVNNVADGMKYKLDETIVGLQNQVKKLQKENDNLKQSVEDSTPEPGLKYK